MKIVKHKVDKTLFILAYDGTNYKVIVPVTFNKNADIEWVPNYANDEGMVTGDFVAAYEETESIYVPEEN